MALNRGTREQEVDLVVAVACNPVSNQFSRRLKQLETRNQPPAANTMNSRCSKRKSQCQGIKNAGSTKRDMSLELHQGMLTQANPQKLRKSKQTHKRSKLTKPSQILNHSQTSLTIRHRSIEIMLFTLLIHTKALKVDVPPRTELRLHWTREVDGTLHVELLHAALHDTEFDGDDACHFDGAAEGDFAVALYSPYS